jgi:hypothetical protein
MMPFGGLLRVFLLHCKKKAEQKIHTAQMKPIQISIVYFNAKRNGLYTPNETPQKYSSFLRFYTL